MFYFILCTVQKKKKLEKQRGGARKKAKGFFFSARTLLSIYQTGKLHFSLLSFFHPI
jgi:hypothetical protein